MWVQVEYLGYPVYCDYTADWVLSDALDYLVWHHSLVDLVLWDSLNNLVNLIDCIMTAALYYQMTLDSPHRVG